jgi:ribosome-associated protein
VKQQATHTLNDMQQDEAIAVSKSRRKRDMDALRKLGEELLSFDETTLTELGIPGNLLDAVRLANRIKSHGARRRQLHYIGKLMRNVDTTPIRVAIEARDHQNSTRTSDFHLLEELREALITEGDSSLAMVLEHFPLADRQHLRKLARQARKERDAHQPLRGSRRLFRYLRELQEDQGTTG